MAANALLNYPRVKPAPANPLMGGQPAPAWDDPSRNPMVALDARGQRIPAAQPGMGHSLAAEGADPIARLLATLFSDIVKAPGRIINPLIAGAQAPGQALSGEGGVGDFYFDPQTGRVSQPGLSDAANNMAGLIASGPAGVAGANVARGAEMVDPNMAGIFGGVGAKTADLGAFTIAKAMKVSGVDDADILAQTGWFQGADGRWRFEIDDSRARLSNPSDSIYSDKSTVGEQFSHNDLMKAYPDLASIRLKRYPPNSQWGGEYTSKGSGGEVISLFGDDTGVMLHELQHAVQHREGFLPGNSPENLREGVVVNNDANHLRTLLEQGIPHPQALEMFKASVNRSPRDLARQIAFNPHIPTDLIKSWPATPFDAYWRQMGEVEARNVANRRGMTAQDRLSLAPWEGESVPMEQQISIGARPYK